MSIKATIASLATFACLNATADEGMWTIGNIPPQVMEQMKGMGLDLRERSIYSKSGESLKASVVMFGNYCSGVVVSDEGLLMTNHHCGYQSIHEHSTIEHDYLKNGFAAKNLGDEIPTPGLYVNFLIEQKDVTRRMMKAVKRGMNETQRQLALNEQARKIESEVKATNPKLFGEVNAFFDGTQFILSIYKPYTDIRLVFAPPSCVGKFGGETDNWMWPRQTGDFSVFRIYADKDGEPADYSPENTPLHTTSYAPVATNGYAEGDLCLTIGYPGETQRYMSSMGIRNMMETVHESNITLSGHTLDIMRGYMKQSDTMRIKYDSKYAQTANGWKNNIGMNESIEKLGIIEQKEALEQMVEKWTLTSKRGAHYRGVVDSLRKAYKENKEILKVEAWFYGALGQSDLINIMAQIMRYDFNTPDTQLETFKKELRKEYTDMDTLVDRQLLNTALTDYRKAMAQTSDSTLYLPEFYTTIDTLYGGNIDAFTQKLYATTAFVNYDSAVALAADTLRRMYNDPGIDFMMKGTMKAFELSEMNHSESITKAEREFAEAVRSMNAENHTFYSDANFTMRLSYGTVGGYSTPEGKNYTYYSTPAEFMEKAAKVNENSDYETSDTIRSVMSQKEFGHYTDPRTGEMQLCFLTNNDITGGNSGSPMFNKNGQLIGLAFDGNWEAMSSDIAFNTRMQRCIGVDIRYVMYIIEKWGGNKRLIDELRRSAGL